MKELINYPEGKLWPKEFQKLVQQKFAFIYDDPDLGKRLFFDNSGGSLRLIKGIEVKHDIDLLPDCTERSHERAVLLQNIIKKCDEDVLRVMFNAKSGSLMTTLSASQCMFQMVEPILVNVKGTNAVTTNLEHPSAYDAVKFYCEQTGKEFRVVEADRETGYIKPEDVAAKVDEGTVLLSVIASSNISGNLIDLKGIIEAAKKKNPDIYIITDAVQHMPHSTLDVDELGVDGANFAPYKFYATRGIGFAYVSDRLSKLPHPKLIAKPDEVWELGTPAPSIFASMSAVVDYICWIGKYFHEDAKTRREEYLCGMHEIEMHERALLYRLLEGTAEVPGLRHLKNVEVYADNKDLTKRDLIVAMGINGMHHTDARKLYAKKGVTVYERINTSLYSKRIVEAIGLSGVIRVSPMHAYGEDDMDTFLKITKDISMS